MSTVSETFYAKVQTVWTQIGQVGTAADVEAHLTPMLSREELIWASRAGVMSGIGRFLRRVSDDGLPQAPEIDEHGTHMQMSLMSVEEYRYAIRRYVELRTRVDARAYAMAKKCMTTHGIWIDPEQFGGSSEAAAQ